MTSRAGFLQPPPSDTAAGHSAGSAPAPLPAATVGACGAFHGATHRALGRLPTPSYVRVELATLPATVPHLWWSRLSPSHAAVTPVRASSHSAPGRWRPAHREHR